MSSSSSPRRALRRAAVVLALAPVLVAGCGGSDEPPPADAGPRRAVVAVGELPSSLDPARASSATARMLAAATQTPLLTYARGGDVRAGALRAALATDLPTLSDDGREYRFQLRSGLLYADGRVVTASDVERGIAHASAVGADPELREVLSVISGAPSEDGETLTGVRSDDRSGSLVVRLRQPDGRVPFALADPATAPMPSLPRDGDVPASTGPLRIAGRDAEAIRLAANPLRPSIDAVAAARLAQITVARREVTTAALASGDPDLTLSDVPDPLPRELTRVGVDGPTIVSAIPAPSGALAPRQARRALADALDRSALAGVRDLAPSCSLIPAFVAGGGDGEDASCGAGDDREDGDDGASGARPLAGVRVRVAATRDEGLAPARAVLAAALRRTGATGQLVVAEDPVASAAAGNADLALTATRSLLAHPASWLVPVLPFDRALQRAAERGQAGPLTGAADRWAALRGRAEPRADAVPLAVTRRAVVAGPSIDRGSIRIHPILGLDLAALDLS